ncbi:MAG: hypothetical protein COB23_04440, partial [Methylophaga sp.]
MEIQLSFYDRLKNAFENTKKELCIIIILLAIIVDVVPLDFLPIDVSNNIQSGLILALSLIILGVLFDILYQLADQNKKITTLESADLFKNIAELIDNEKTVTISYIAIAGNTGWGSVLSKLLDPKDSHSILHKPTVNINIALIDESVLELLEDSRTRYESVTNTCKEIEIVKEKISKQGYSNVKINLYRYKHMPNILGFLINDNYLFSALSYWEIEDGTDHSLVLRGGRRNHII